MINTNFYINKIVEPSEKLMNKRERVYLTNGLFLFSAEALKHISSWNPPVLFLGSAGMAFTVPVTQPIEAGADIIVLNGTFFSLVTKHNQTSPDYANQLCAATIGHELAHCEYRRLYRSASEPNISGEIEVDKIAISWGLRDHLLALFDAMENAALTEEIPGSTHARRAALRGAF